MTNSEAGKGAEIKRETELEMEIDGLKNDLLLIVELFHEIATRIQPVLRDLPPSPATEDKEPLHPSSPRAGQIALVRRTLAELECQMRDVASRIEEENNTMKIVSVKQTNDGITIVYQQHVGTNGSRTITLSSEDEPRPEFSEAVQALRPFLRSICEFSTEYASEIIIVGVAFKTNSAGNKSAIIKAMRPMAVGTPLNISTPSRMMDTEEDDAPTMLSADAVIALEALEDEAVKYIKGDRMQQQLPLEGDGEEEG